MSKVDTEAMLWEWERARMKTHFPNGTPVEIKYNIGNKLLEGKRGRVIGLHSDTATIIFYIVLLDEPLEDGATGVVLIDSHLQRFMETEPHGTVKHEVTCKLFPDPFDERDPVGPCTCKGKQHG
jgi:hypothetical protein